MGICRKPSWSITRSRTFELCPRKGFFEYYAEGEPEAYHAWNLRELVTLPMLVGEVVDLVISAALRRVSRGESLPQNMAAVGIKTFDRALGASQRLVSSMKQSARTAEARRLSPHKPLLEDWYGQEPGAEYLDSLRGHVALCLDTFEFSEVLTRMVEAGASSWGPFTRSMRTRPYIEVDGLPVFTSFDFYFEEEGQLFILDWKSGHPSAEAVDSGQEQLDLYALYGAMRLEFTSEHIYTQAIWLRESGEWNPRSVTAESLQRTASIVRSQIASERSRVQVDETDGSYRADRADFPPAASAKKCRSCKYLEICPQGQSACNMRRPPASDALRRNTG